MNFLSFHLVSFGCKVNQAEGEDLAQRLRALGIQQAADEGGADLVIVNTCAVTGEAARQCRQRIRRALRAGRPVIVTGCAAHPAAEDASIRQLPGVLLVDPDKDRALARLAEYLAPGEHTGGRMAAGHGASLSRRSRAMLKVQDGCPASCAYCIVPLVRPTLRSLAPGDAARRVEELAAQGFREIVLCGIHLGLYGADLEPRTTLVELLDRLAVLDGEFRLRLSSLEPMEAADPLLALMAARPERLCPHLHLPLQSGSDAVLGRMGRPYTAAGFLRVIEKIRNAIPRAAISTDVLAGFPGETDEDFAATLHLAREAAFSRVHVFPFSRRPGTGAARMPEQVSAGTIRARRAEASGLGERLAAEYRAGLVGTTARVVIEDVFEDGSAEGLSERYVCVRINPRPVGQPNGGTFRRHEIVPVRLVRAGDAFLEGEAAGP